MQHYFFKSASQQYQQTKQLTHIDTTHNDPCKGSISYDEEHVMTKWDKSLYLY